MFANKLQITYIQYLLAEKINMINNQFEVKFINLEKIQIFYWILTIFLFYIFLWKSK